MGSRPAAPNNGLGDSIMPLPGRDQVPDSPTVTVSFAGTDTFLASSASAPFTVTEEEATLTYTGETLIANGRTAQLSAVLKEDGTTRLRAAASVPTGSVASGMSTVTSMVPPTVTATPLGLTDLLWLEKIFSGYDIPDDRRIFLNFGGQISLALRNADDFQNRIGVQTA